MIPANVEGKLAKLVSGQASFNSANLGFNLLVSRLQKKYSANPSPDAMKASIAEIKDFLEKYNNIMAHEFPALAAI